MIDCIPNTTGGNTCLNCGWVKPEKIVGWPRRNCSRSPDLIPAAERLGLTLDAIGQTTAQMLARYAAGQPLGPGDWLHIQILRWVGESPTQGCNCKNRIAQMNQWGPAGCREHLEEIVAWLNEEALKKGWFDLYAMTGNAGNKTAYRKLRWWKPLAYIPGRERFIRWLVNKAIKKAQAKWPGDPTPATVVQSNGL